MNARENLLAIVQHSSTDRGLLWPDGFWAETRNRWLQEGMTEDFDFGFDYNKTKTWAEVGVNLEYFPPWNTGVIEEKGGYELFRDEYGVISKVPKNAVNRNIAQYISFPVSTSADWERLKPRLDPNTPGRFPGDWLNKAACLNCADYPVVFESGHLSGFFSFLRELFGVEEVYYLLADDPGLAREILDFQVYRLTALMRRITKDVSVDSFFIWEDMCYKNGPLIGPDMFRRFFSEPYSRTIEAARDCGIPIVDVDSDGNTMDLIPLWMEAGVNMHHPMEVAAGMDVVEVKRRFGEELTIRGGIDKRELTKDFAAIDREFERIRPAYEMGGYIPHVDHAVPPNVSWDNYRYYLDKRRELIHQ